MALGAKRSWQVEDTITRPANTTTYTAKDGVSTTAGEVLTFAGVAPHAGMGGKITGIHVHKTDQDEANATFHLYLFDTTFAIAGINDNAVIAITDAEFQTSIPFIEMLAADWADVVTGSVYSKTNLDINYQCAGTDTALYGGLVAKAAYDPASAEVFTIRLFGEVN